MHLFFIFISVCALIASFLSGHILGGAVCAVVLFLLLWSRLFSKQIILRSFSKLKPIKNTVFFRKEQLAKTIFNEAKTLETYVSFDNKSVQAYCVQISPPCLVLSKQFLEEQSNQEILKILKITKDLSLSKSYFSRQRLVAMFLHIGFLFKSLDSILCFVLGLSSINGEPRALVRKITSPILNWLCTILSPRLDLETDNEFPEAKAQLSSFSYLSKKHVNSLLSPISPIDSILDS